MIVTTKLQRLALYAVYRRDPLYPCEQPHRPARFDQAFPGQQPLTYRAWRKLAEPSFDGSGCIMVPYGTMWLGIERDGYTHS